MMISEKEYLIQKKTPLARAEFFLCFLGGGLEKLNVQCRYCRQCRNGHLRMGTDFYGRLGTRHSVCHVLWHFRSTWLSRFLCSVRSGPFPFALTLCFALLEAREGAARQPTTSERHVCHPRVLPVPCVLGTHGLAPCVRVAQERSPLKKQTDHCISHHPTFIFKTNVPLFPFCGNRKKKKRT